MKKDIIDVRLEPEELEELLRDLPLIVRELEDLARVSELTKV